MKNTSLNKININNIKIVNNKSDNHHKKKKNKSEKHYKNNKLKLITKRDLSLYLDKSESKKHSQTKYVKTKLKNDKPTSILYNVNDEIKEERSARKNNTSRKNIKTYRTVQLKPISKIQIDSNSHKNENNKKDKENSTRIKNDKQK